MESGKEPSKIGVVLSYSVVAVFALAFILSPIISILDHPEDKREGAIIALIGVIIIAIILNYHRNTIEKIEMEKREEARKLERESRKRNDEAYWSMKELEKENKKLKDLLKEKKV